MRKVVIAGMIGNGLEWYDYALYGHFAAIISTQFFPSENVFVSMIATFSVFAAGFLMRPLGALVFGYIGDRYGRRVSLAISILLMAIPTACIGLLPTYEQIGILAPVLLTIIRVLQGLALGGEFSGSITYVVEHAPANRRGLAGSTSLISMMLGILIGAAAATACAELLTEEEFNSWGWRVPFVAGLVIGLIGFYIRSMLDESPAYEEAKEAGHLSETPLKEVFTKHWKDLVLCIGLYIAVTIPFYVYVMFMNSYMHKILHYPLNVALYTNTVGQFAVLLLIPVFGWLCDRIGRKPIFIMASVGYLLCSYPVFQLIESGNPQLALIAQLIFAVILAAYITPIPAVLVEQFPTSVRYTGMALACNICAALFGGTAPMVVTWLIKVTGDNTAVAAYVTVAAAISFVATCFYKETNKIPLNR